MAATAAVGQLAWQPGMTLAAVKEARPTEVAPVRSRQPQRQRGARRLVVQAEAPQPGKDNKGDWDSAWTAFKRSKRSGRSISGFLRKFNLDMEKYVSRSPQSNDYSSLEELDPYKRTEKSALKVWTDIKFTYAGFGVIFGLLVYMVVIVGPPPPH
eukprot:SM000058S18529  [mRNA]  locus=s58:388138:389223:+ [translate_table: standard]